MVAIAAVFAFAVPAAAYDTQWDFPSGGDHDENVQIDLELDCYIQVDWQDKQIEFDEAGDWWSDQLQGAGYAACPDDDGKYPTDPWAGDSYYAGATGRYYESADGAVIYVNSNNTLSMMVHTNGDLTATDPDCGDCSIPTWFTVALAPFYVDGVQLTTGPIPGDGDGSYLFDDSGEFGYDDPTYNYPNQYAFPCDPASETWTLGPLCPHVHGTIKFLARMLRHGMADAGGDYNTWLDVTFTTP